MYHNYGSRIHRDIFINCLNLLYKNPISEVDLPSAARINLLHQANDRRLVLHLLYSTPIKRGIASVIEDFVPLSNIKVNFDFEKEINCVTLLPDDKVLSVTKNGLKQFVIIPKFKSHCILVFNYSVKQLYCNYC